MDKVSKWLAVFLIVYALLGIAHLLFIHPKHAETDVQIETPAP